VALGQLFVSGVDLEWPAGGRRVDLPTYAFRHERYWPRPVRQVGAGLTAANHPVLDAAIEVAARVPAARYGGAVEIRPSEVYW